MNSEDERAARSAQARRAAQAPRTTRPPVDRARPDAVMTIPEWCDLNGFSVATGHRILRRGDGPRIVQLGLRRKGVRVSDNLAWQDSRLQGT